MKENYIYSIEATERSKDSAKVLKAIIYVYKLNISKEHVITPVWLGSDIWLESFEGPPQSVAIDIILKNKKLDHEDRYDGFVLHSNTLSIMGVQNHLTDCVRSL